MRGYPDYDAKNANKPGFDSFGNPATTAFGSLGGMTLPPAVTLSEREGENAQVEAFEQAEDGRSTQDEDDEQLRQLGDRFNA